MADERLLILDGHSLMNRAFYALPELTNDEGLHTNAVYGFVNMLLKMKEEMSPDYIVCTFDRSVPTFRHEKYGEYKAGRKKMPLELSEQFPVLKEILKLLSIDTFEIDGFEADDIMGTLSSFAEGRGIEVYIVTGDRDLLQLASDKINIVITKKGITEKEIYDRNRMLEDYGITPDQFIDVKGLMGDSSDNIPGVPGIGEKTAFKLIKEYKNLENVLQNIDNIKGKKLKENLKEYSEQAVFSKKLATIVKDVPIEINLDSIKSKDSYNVPGLRDLFEKLQFKSLMNKIPGFKELEDKSSKIEVNVENVDDIDKFRNLVGLVEEAGGNEILYINFTTSKEQIYSESYIDRIFIRFSGHNYVVSIKSILDEDNKSAGKLLHKLFSKINIEKVGYNVKTAYSILYKMGIDLQSVIFDIKIAAYILNPSDNLDLKSIIKKYAGFDIPEEDDKFMEKATSLLENIYKCLKAKIEEADMEKLMYEMELPLVHVLSSMECEGFKVDKDKLQSLGVKFKAEIDRVQKEIYELAEEEFNINSPKQLGKILFEKLDLPVIKKTKTGYSTNVQVLEKLMDKHPVIEKIVYYRQLSKIYSTYVEGLSAVIDRDGKIHSNFNQTVTATGRLSSTEPNLQNIPVKYEMGKEIRKVFVPENCDCVIMSADYSQIELRVLAHIADDKNLIDAFKHHSDIHTKTASEVFNVPIDEVTKRQRSNAKAVNFGIIYGIGDFSLSKDLNITRSEAKNYIDTYFKRYPNVKRYMDDIVKSAKETGYVTTIMNRRRFIKEMHSSNKVVRSLGERLAMNTPIQGSAADIIKMAMINVYNELNTRKLKSRLILQVHDELILNVYKDEIDEVKDILKFQMENAVSLKVPLEVDMNMGNNWYEIK
ncbi:MAG: DNA polymerase I [Clostridium sp.]|jgi:DNA polymerase-1|uniref:DNA polymerase I n=3 Tax=Clostridium sp. TaxID=1506 RepID=UPI0025C3096A|nr:DNA polymerase I [Clostridium sp.]MCH3964748.1 DNA polymerase I [Clostridium sp.]MCI1715219.1 DNA polymerase I [Clostridium sp.]MCI1799481.1 DNA polymerase I [Clostridium sp.]MCI1813402.1 DNA polymerase I [Clostridium sp.]MCI1870293.1 DNA polymerase I [Clostridium sp.]